MAARTWTFLLDVDNTLLDNDAVKDDLDHEIRREFGPALADEFWAVYEEVRDELDHVDYPEVLRRFCAGAVPPAVAERLAALVNAIPYDRYRYPGALEALAHLAALGTTVILSDGDHEYQPRKIAHAGLAAAVDGRVVITTHKEGELDGVRARFPSDRYVMIDDKPSILVNIKRRDPGRFRTILVRQGKYGHEALPPGPPPDLTVDHIGELRDLRLDQLDG
jgi:beta-phosphoglucomutase-like phosphatase (HAD superfamily)